MKCLVKDNLNLIGQLVFFEIGGLMRFVILFLLSFAIGWGGKVLPNAICIFVNL